MIKFIKKILVLEKRVTELEKQVQPSVSTVKTRYGTQTEYKYN